MEQIILYGLRASGKSTIGREFAEKHGKSFIDLDDYIVEKVGMDISQFVEENGWDAFRDVEHESLQDILESDYEVVSLGGGTIEFDRNRKEIEKHKVRIAYLSIDVKTQLERILTDKKGNKNRPSLTDQGLEKELNEIYKKRERIYYWFAKIIEEDSSIVDAMMVNAKQFEWQVLRTLSRWQ